MLNLPDELYNFDYMMDEIRDRFAEQHEWSDDDLHDFVILMERFAKCSKYDISAEMNDYRRSLITKLHDSQIEELDEVTEELEMAFGRSERETMGGRSKDFSQIAGVKDSYVFADDWDMPDGAKLPLWMLGFLY